MVYSNQSTRPANLSNSLPINSIAQDALYRISSRREIIEEEVVIRARCPVQLIKWAYNLLQFRRILCAMVTLSICLILIGIILGILNTLTRGNLLAITLACLGIGTAIAFYVGIYYVISPKDHEPCLVLFNLHQSRTGENLIHRNRNLSISNGIFWGNISPDFVYIDPPPIYDISMLPNLAKKSLITEQIQNGEGNNSIPTDIEMENHAQIEKNSYNNQKYISKNNMNVSIEMYNGAFNKSVSQYKFNGLNQANRDNLLKLSNNFKHGNKPEYDLNKDDWSCYSKTPSYRSKFSSVSSLTQNSLYSYKHYTYSSLDDCMVNFPKEKNRLETLHVSLEDINTLKSKIESKWTGYINEFI